jgi:hypothetical protein
VRRLSGRFGGLLLFGSYRLELQLGVLELLLELVVGLPQSLAVLLFEGELFLELLDNRVDL